MSNLPHAATRPPTTPGTSEIAANLQAPGTSVSIRQAAKLLHVSTRAIYKHIRNNELRTTVAEGSRQVLLESLYELGFQPQPFPASASAATFPLRPSGR